MRKPALSSPMRLGALAIAAVAGLAVAAAPPTDTTGEPVGVKVVDEQGNEQTLDFGSLAARFAGGAGRSRDRGELAPWKEVSKGFEQVSTTPDGDLFGLWVNNEDKQMLLELPRGFERQKHFIATTVAQGEIFAGLQGPDFYVQWKRYGKDRVAILLPQIDIRSTGDQESKDSVDQIFTDRVLTDVPIISTGPNGQPVIDLDDLLINNASTFFRGGFRSSGAGGLNTRLVEFESAKSFPENAEIAFSAPDRNGVIKTFHYSLSKIQGTPGYRPREADERLGYFVTSHEDYGQFERDDVYVRYINRWNIEKADPRLDMSPPKEPLVYYVEHTVPVRYRRWVKAGTDYWNQAFRKIGIDGAIEVRYQDKQTGAHMDKDPEDVRYNFIRWLSNDIATAIGPSRVDPMTGEILDADVILTDGWIRAFTGRWQDQVPDLAAEGYSAQTLEWLESHPRWDPRIRLAPPERREQVARAIQARAPLTVHGGHPLMGETPLLLDGEPDLANIAGADDLMLYCLAADGLRRNMEVARLHLAALGPIAELIGMNEELSSQPELPELPPEIIERIKKQLAENPEYIDFIPPQYRDMIKSMLEEEKPEEEVEETDAEGEETESKPEKPRKKTKSGTKGDTIDGLPEFYVGPALAELVAHEVGHTIGLRHNFKGSSAYKLSEINSPEFKGNKAWSATVMDYNGINIFMPSEDDSTGTVQGDFSSINIGPYDYWVIEYGYTMDDPKKVLERVAEPGLDFGTDEDNSGPDPTVRPYDLSADPIDWARSQITLAEFIRDSLLDDFVEEGESWSRVRDGYFVALNSHFRAVQVMGDWVGGAYTRRDKKGDPNARIPVEPVEVEKQREALEFVIGKTFYDDAFGINPELLRYMTVDKWFDGGGSLSESMFEVHDRILGIQASALTALMNPTKLRRVYDNEMLTDPGEDALTLSELMRHITENAWSELDEPVNGSTFTSREPMISSLRRNFQREHLDRLIDLAGPDTISGAAGGPVRTLSTMHLRELHGGVEAALEAHGDRMDDYTKAHLQECEMRIAQVLDSKYIYNQSGDINLNLGGLFGLFGQEDSGNK